MRSLTRHLAISLLLHSWSSQAATAVTLVNDVWSPYVEADGRQGLAIEIVRAALQQQQRTLTVQIKPWARAYRDVQSCNNDLILVWYEASRLHEIRYSAPFLTNRLRFIKRLDDSFEYQDLAHLAGKSIGVIRGYNYQNAFINNPSYYLSANHSLSANLQMLALKRIDLVVEDELVAATTIFQQRMEGQFIFTGPALDERQLYVATGTCNAEGEALIDSFNQGLTAIRANGEYQQLVDKYRAILQSRKSPVDINTIFPALRNPPFKAPLIPQQLAWWQATPRQ
ncbi:transporter substrate-binding domain-containing protein [Shewanella sp. A3A]|nr:transporter substrate-binding domain-containing protein [Shewanella ferrihydritica]